MNRSKNVKIDGCRLQEHVEITGAGAAIDEQIAAQSIEIALRPVEILLEEHSKHRNIAKRDPEIENAKLIRI